MANSVAFDPTQALSNLQGLLGQFGPSQADLDAANKARLFDIAAGLLGARRGYEFSALGQGLEKGQADYANMLKTLPAIRASNLQAVLPLAQMQMRLGMLNNFMGALNAAQQPTTVPGPSETFQAGPRTAGNAFSGNAPPPVNLPTQQQVPAGTVDPSLRQRLAQANLGLSMFGVNATPALQFMFPQPVRVNQGGGVYDPASRTFNVIPQTKPGYQPVQDASGQWRVEPVPGGPAANVGFSGAEAIGKTMGEAPVETVNAKGQTTLPSGSRYTQLYPQGDPFQVQPTSSMPSPSAQAPAAAPPNTGTASTRSAPPAASGNVTKLSPTQTSELEERGKSYGEQADTIDEQAKQAAYNITQNKEMRALFSQFQTGSWAATRREVAGYLKPLLPESADNYIAGGNLAAMQAAQKQVVQTAFQNVRTLTPRPAQSEVMMSAKQGTANELMQPGAINAILDFNDSVNKYFLDKQQAKDQWLADPAHANSLAGFEGNFNRTHPMSAYTQNLPAVKSLLGITVNSKIGQTPSASASSMSSTGATPAFTLTPAGRANQTLQALLKRETPTAAQLNILRLNGLVQ